MSLRQKAERELEENERRLQACNKTLVKLTKSEVLGSGNLKAALAEIAVAATEALEIERASVWFYGDGKKKIKCIELYEQSKDGHSGGLELKESDYPLYFQALQADRVIAAHNAHTDPATREFSESYLTPLGINSMLDAPIRVGERTIGVVCNEHVGITRKWSLIEQNFAGSIADLVSLAIEVSERKQLEQQIRESLNRRERQVQTSTEIAQRIASVSDLNELFEQVVNLIQARFNYYHVHIYTLEKDNLVMQAGSGQIGQKLKIANHQIPMDAKKSLVSRSARNREPVLARNVTLEAEWLPNRLLPDTKAELAIPIILGERLLGVLDVQNDAVDSLNEEDQLLLLGLAGQIATAIESTRLLEEANIFRQFVDASGQGMGFATLEGDLIYVNPKFADLLDEPKPEQVISKPLSLYFSPETQSHLQDEILPALNQIGHWSGELPLYT
jgi:GAF domain-containing protein